MSQHHAGAGPLFVCRMEDDGEPISLLPDGEQALDLARENERLRAELGTQAAETADEIENLLAEYESGGLSSAAFGRALAALIRELRQADPAAPRA